MFVYFYKKLILLLIKKYIQIVLLLLFEIVVSQNDSIIKGKIVVANNYNDGVTIVNISNKTNTISGNGGYFVIKAKVNDTLLFSSLQFDVIKLKMTATDFGQNLLFIKMTPRSKLIEKVIITNQTVITAESLGLVPKGQKRYTVAERRMKSGGGGIGIGGLINLFTGYGKELKRNLEIEKKEILIEKIRNQFEKAYFVKTLQIPENYIDGFLYYIGEDKKSYEILNSTDKYMKMFKLAGLAVEYLKTVQPETPKSK